jgi:hypothetical protein
VPIEELIDVQMHFFSRPRRAERLSNQGKKCARAPTRSNRGKNRRLGFFWSLWDTLFLIFQSRLFFRAQIFFPLFFLSVLRAISNLKPCARAKEETM